MAGCSIIYVGEPAVGMTANDAPMINAAIAQVNISGGVLQFGPGPYQIRGRLDPITCSETVIRGCDSLTTLVAKGSFSGLGNFFRFGTAGMSIKSSGVENFRLEIDSDASLPSPNVFAVDLINGVDLWAKRIRCERLAGLIRLGDGASSVNRGTIEDWKGDVGNGGKSSSIILVEHGSSTRFSDIHVNGSPEEESNGATIRFNPQSGANIDTIWFTRCAMQIMKRTKDENDNNVYQFGKPRAVYFMRKFASITNVFFESCNFDHTSLMAVAFDGSDTPGEDPGRLFSRNIRFNNCRFNPDSGGAVRIDNTGGGTLRGFIMDGCTMSTTGSTPVVELNAPDYPVGLKLVNNNFGCSGASAKTSAVVLNGNLWVCADNIVGRVGDSNSAATFATGFSIQGSSSNAFVMGPNVVEPDVPVSLSQPTYVPPTGGVPVRRQVV